MKIIEEEPYIYRWATIEDIDAAVDTMLQAFDGEAEMGSWVRMMMDGSHASAKPRTVAVAEQKSTKKIAAVITTCPQTWYYCDIPLKAMNISEVGTHPDFRGKGLIRKLMQMIHTKLAEEKYDISLVWGVPWFYKKFGYYQTLSNKASKSYARTDLLSKWNSPSPYVIRPMTLKDIPFGVQLHLQACQKNLLSFPYDTNYWKMFVFDYFEQNRNQFRIIEQDGVQIGIFDHNSKVDRSMHTQMFDLLNGVSWLEVTPWVTGYLLNYGDNMQNDKSRLVESVTYSLREGHPVYEIMRDCYGKEQQPEQNYYRIVDIPAYLLTIRPVLEKRIQESYICGYTRIISIQLFDYKDIITLHFESGKITKIATDGHQLTSYYDIHMPLEFFMQIIFGQRDIDDYLNHNREVGSWNDGKGVDNELRILFMIMFPKMPSHINHCL